MMRVIVAVLAVPLLARAEMVEVTINNVRSAEGHVRVAICGKADFLKEKCAYDMAVPSMKGTTTVRLEVPPGTYAAQGYLDEKDWGEVRRTFLGLPRNGIGFSRDAPFRFGPPSFEDAQFVVVAGTTTRTAMTLRYFD